MPEAPKLPDDWTEPERWAWQQIAAGKEADFNEQAQKSSGAAEPLDPKSPDGWGPDRRLRADFLQHILTDPSFVEATPYRGVRIRGALIDDEPLDLKNARLPHQFWLEKSRIETGIQGRNIRVDGGFSLERSYVAGAVQLPGAKIAEGLSLAAGASFAGPVILNSAKVTGPVSLNDGASFSDEVDLTSARIGADLDLSNAAFAAAVRLTNARIGSELRLGSKDHRPVRWGSGPLDLRNTHCASLQDRWPTEKEPEDPAWPTEIDLEGFTYGRLGGLLGSGGGPADMRARPSSSYEAWLARHHPFSPQPYEQLAKVLRASGEPGKANDILYAARERQRREYRDAKAWDKWLGLSVLKCTIGYGLGRRYFWVPMFWILLFTAVGTLLLQFCGNQPEKDWLALAFASFDQLLPAVTLDRAHDKLFSIATGTAKTDSYVQPAGLIMYFYVHKLIGWLLGIFLLAGLAGLTQRS